MEKRLFLFLLLGVLLAASGCKILNPSIMLRTDRDYQYAEPPDSISPEYVIAPNDILQFRLYSNNGFKVIDLTTASEQNAALTQQRLNITYLVEFDGRVNMPVIGRVMLAGKTLREAEYYLENQYASAYREPFVMLKVLNRRVIIFTGIEGEAKVVNLENENTTVMEALARAGGIAQMGKAHKIKLIRQTKDAGKPEVFLIDLSEMEGIAMGEMLLQSNDIIYVEPRFRLLREVLEEITPIVSLASSTIVIIAAINNLNR